MNGRLGHLGDTWTVRYGSRAGIQVRGRDGTLRRPAYRGWSSEAYAPPARGGMYAPVPAEGPYGLNVRGMGDLGDKYDDATKEAWDASHWVWGRPVKTRADAIVAARWLYLQAAREGRAGHFNDLARRCAYGYDTSGITPKQILQVVWNETRKDAPRTAGKAQALRAQLDRDGRAQPQVDRRSAASPKRAHAQETALRKDRAAEPQTIEEGTSSPDWMELVKKWGPWVAGGAAAVVLGKMLLSSSSKTVRVVGP